MATKVVETLLKIAANYLILRTPDGLKKMPYKNAVVSYGGMVLRELLRKMVKVIV